MATNNNYVYFYFSDQQIKEKNKVLEKSGKEFVPGFVVTGGKREKISAIVSDKRYMSRFFDAVIVAEGEKASFTYQMPDVNYKNYRR